MSECYEFPKDFPPTEFLLEKIMERFDVEVPGDSNEYKEIDPGDELPCDKCSRFLLRGQRNLKIKTCPRKFIPQRREMC